MHGGSTGLLKIEAKLVHLELQRHHADLRLSDVRPVQRVQAICANDASLNRLDLLLSQIFDEVAMIENLLVHLLDHHLERLVAVAAAKPVEVKVEELDLGLLGELVHLPNVLSCDAHFTRCVVPEQVDDLAWSVRVKDVLEVQSEGLLGHFGVSSEENVLSQAPLLPEDGYRPAYLHVTDQEAPSDDHDLLRLAKVGHVAHVIDASRVIARPGSIPHSARNQRQLGLNTVQRPRCLRKVTLNQRREPATVHLLPDKVSVERQVPEVLLVTGDQLERIRYFLLHPGQTALARRCQIITVREVKAIFEVLFDIFHHLNRLLRSALLYTHIAEVIRSLSLACQKIARNLL